MGGFCAKPGILLVVGLGNPGAAYLHSRHNLGQFILDDLARNLNLKWINNRRLNADLARGRLGRQEILLARPLSYMNDSGYPVQRIANYFKVPHEEIVIVYDDISLPLGEFKITRRCGSGGHNGMADVCDKLGECVRFRVGIGSKPDKEMDLKDFVLGKFSDEEQAAILYAMPTILTAIKSLANNPETST
jgi:PTH1 family peptidyl-tRNA hydrolase